MERKFSLETQKEYLECFKYYYVPDKKEERISSPSEFPMEDDEWKKFDAGWEYCYIQGNAIVAFEMVGGLRNEANHPVIPIDSPLICACRWSMGKIMRSPCFKEFQPTLIQWLAEAGYSPLSVLKAVQADDFTVSLKEHWPKIREDFVRNKNGQ